MIIWKMIHSKMNEMGTFFLDGERRLSLEFVFESHCEKLAGGDDEVFFWHLFGTEDG